MEFSKSPGSGKDQRPLGIHPGPILHCPIFLSWVCTEPSFRVSPLEHFFWPPLVGRSAVLGSLAAACTENYGPLCDTGRASFPAAVPNLPLPVMQACAALSSLSSVPGPTVLGPCALAPPQYAISTLPSFKSILTFWMNSQWYVTDCQRCSRSLSPGTGIEQRQSSLLKSQQELESKDLCS